MRVQCLWRRRKASRSLEDQMRRLVEEEREAAARAKFLNAACIQALARGVRRRAWFARNHASLVDSKTIRGALLRMRARQAAEVEKVTARMRHLDKFGPSEYLWSGVRDELEGVTRENEAPSEAGPANEPWQEQHWSERLPAIAGEGRSRRVGGAVGRQRAGDVLVQPEDGRGVLGRPDAAALVGDAGASKVFIRPMCLFVSVIALRAAWGPIHGPRTDAAR